MRGGGSCASASTTAPLAGEPCHAAMASPVSWNSRRASQINGAPWVYAGPLNQPRQPNGIPPVTRNSADSARDPQPTEWPRQASSVFAAPACTNWPARRRRLALNLNAGACVAANRSHSSRTAVSAGTATERPREHKNRRRRRGAEFGPERRQRPAERPQFAAPQTTTAHVRAENRRLPKCPQNQGVVGGGRSRAKPVSAAAHTLVTGTFAGTLVEIGLRQLRYSVVIHWKIV